MTQIRGGQAYFFMNNKDIIIAFRGTKGIKDIFTDIKIWNKATKNGGIHAGFNSQYQYLIEPLKRLTKKHITGNHRIWVTGHSLGGALAAIYTVNIESTFQARVGGVYTYGQPPSGNKEFNEYLKNSLPDGFFRVTNNSDSIVGGDENDQDRAGVEIFFDSNKIPYCGRPDLGFLENTISFFRFGHNINYYKKLLEKGEVIKEGVSLKTANSRCHLIVGIKKA